MLAFFASQGMFYSTPFNQPLISWNVGRVTDITLPGPEDDPDATPVYSVLYEDGDDEVMSQDDALQAVQAFDSSGFALTTGWSKPKAGIRQLRRLDKKLKRRRRQASKQQSSSG